MNSFAAKKTDNLLKEESNVTIENCEIDRAVQNGIMTGINFIEGEVLVETSNFGCVDFNSDNCGMTGNDITNAVEFSRPNNEDGESSNNPFNFHGCNITFNYYQK